MNLRKEKTLSASQHYLGWIARRTTSLSPVVGEIFLLTIPFIERANDYRDGLGVDSIDREQGPLPNDLVDQCRHAGTEEKHGGSKEAFA